MRTPSFPRRLFAALLCLSSMSPLLAQVCLNEDEPAPPPSMLGGGGNLYETRHGRYLPTRGTLRVLVVLVEVDYQTPGEPDPTGTNGYPGWPAHQLPTWVDNVDPNINLFDHNVPSGTATGLITRYFQDASSGQFKVIADYLKPDSAAIFHTSGTTGSISAAIAAVNSSRHKRIHTSIF